MVFVSPSWVPEVSQIPDSIPISEFILGTAANTTRPDTSKPPYTCGVTGREYSTGEVRERVDNIAKGLSRDLAWHPNEGTEWEKVVAIFSPNTIDYLPVCWAVHRLSGIISPANAAYSSSELSYQLTNSGAKALFTCPSLLPIALEAASKSGIPERHVYLFDLKWESYDDFRNFQTVNDLIAAGSRLAPLDSLTWNQGQAATQTAFICYSSGTSGLPKGVMISHRNVIANVLQTATYDQPLRDRLGSQSSTGTYNDVVLGVLPQSHIYPLLFCHWSTYRGDQIVVLPKFDLSKTLEAIQKYRIKSLYLVPPILVAMIKNKKLLGRYNLSSVRSVTCAAAPLAAETTMELQKQWPGWIIKQGYGLTETAVGVCSTAEHDIWQGSCGSLIPLVEARLVDMNGEEINSYDQEGEILIRSPSVVLGYLKNEEANRETFQNGWLRTGDVAVIRKSEQGNEHVFIVDRIKELIKVKGFQVAPAELEAHLLKHPGVVDCAVIGVPDEYTGEIPKAFVVIGPDIGDLGAHQLVGELHQHVRRHKARYKWLQGGIEFVDVIPKSPSGKILRRMLRDREAARRKKTGARL